MLSTKCQNHAKQITQILIYKALISEQMYSTKISDKKHKTKSEPMKQTSAVNVRNVEDTKTPLQQLTAAMQLSIVKTNVCRCQICQYSKTADN